MAQHDYCHHDHCQHGGRVCQKAPAELHLLSDSQVWDSSDSNCRGVQRDRARGAVT